MVFRKTEAICLFRTDYSETSQIVTFYTADCGKVTALSRGNKRPKHHQLEPVDLLTHSEIVFIDKTPKGLHLLTEYTVKNEFPRLRNRLERLYQGLYLAEFLNELTPPGDPNQALFNLALGTINKIQDAPDNKSGSIWEAIFYFEANSLKQLGFMPRMIPGSLGKEFQCELCSNQIGEKKTLKFSSRYGGILCDDCGRAHETIGVTPGVLKTVLWYAGIDRDTADNCRNLNNLKVSRTMLSGMREFLNYYIASIIGKKLRLTKWLNSSAACEVAADYTWQ
ncbi:MAG: DNA repair protein RecO [Planctomycetota bacterium]